MVNSEPQLLTLTLCIGEISKKETFRFSVSISVTVSITITVSVQKSSKRKEKEKHCDKIRDGGINI